MVELKASGAGAATRAGAWAVAVKTAAMWAEEEEMRDSAAVAGVGKTVAEMSEVVVMAVAEAARVAMVKVEAVVLAGVMEAVKLVQVKEAELEILAVEAMAQEGWGWAVVEALVGQALVEAAVLGQAVVEAMVAAEAMAQEGWGRAVVGVTAQEE